MALPLLKFGLPLVTKGVKKGMDKKAQHDQEAQRRNENQSGQSQYAAEQGENSDNDNDSNNETASRQDNARELARSRSDESPSPARQIYKRLDPDDKTPFDKPPSYDELKSATHDLQQGDSKQWNLGAAALGGAGGAFLGNQFGRGKRATVGGMAAGVFAANAFDQYRNWKAAQRHNEEIRANAEREQGEREESRRSRDRRNRRNRRDSRYDPEDRDDYSEREESRRPPDRRSRRDSRYPEEDRDSTEREDPYRNTDRRERRDSRYLEARRDDYADYSRADSRSQEDARDYEYDRRRRRRSRPRPRREQTYYDDAYSRGEREYDYDRRQSYNDAYGSRQEREYDYDRRY